MGDAVEFPGAKNEEPEEKTEAPAEAPAEAAPEVQPDPTAEVENLTPEERIPYIETALRDLYQRTNLLMGLMSSLAEGMGVELKTRQTPNGVQYYWDKAGRIILPNGRMH